MLKSYCRKSVSTKYSYIHVAFFHLKTIFIFLSLSVSLSWADTSNSDGLIKVGFVSFEVGEYRQERFGEVGRLFNKLNKFPENISIRLLGHSHSVSNLASKKLANMRASAIRDQLINFGVSSASITIDYDVQNFLAKHKLLHGVSVLVVPNGQFQGNSISNKEMITSGAKNAVRTFNSPVQASVILPSSIELQNDRDACSRVSLTTGSLRGNLEREIGDCGYIMGRWRFGSGDEVIDWYVPVAFTAVEDDGIIGLLQLIERNYQIRAQIHELDNSIDFFPSIRDRGNRSQ